MAEETQICESCDAVIGKSETKCPKCGVDLGELAETVSAIEKANAVIAKRKAKAEQAAKDAAPAPAPEPETKSKGVSRLRSLGRAFAKRGE